MKVETLKDSYQLSSSSRSYQKQKGSGGSYCTALQHHSSGGRPGSSSAKTRKSGFKAKSGYQRQVLLGCSPWHNNIN